MTRLLSLLLVLPVFVLLVFVAAPALADDPPPVVVRARAEPATVTVGTRFRYVVEVSADIGTETVVTQPTERIGDFDIVDFGIEPAVQQIGKTLVRRWYTLVGYHPGDHTLVSPPVRYRVGEERRDAPPVEVHVTIESVLAKTPDATDIRDIKAPEPVPIDWRPYYILGGGLLAALVLAWGLSRLLNRDPRARAATPPRPAHEVAFAELERLRARGLVAQGAFKEYYSALSTIVRTYLEQRFGLRAPEMTTEEFLLASARDARLLPAHRRLLGEFLTESDLVKFARHLPSIAASERALEAARRFVGDTAAAATTPEGQRAAG